MENSQFTRCGFFIKGRPDALLSSNGDNRFFECFTNADPSGWTDTDKNCGMSFIDDDTFQFTTV